MCQPTNFFGDRFALQRIFVIKYNFRRKTSLVKLSENIFDGQSAVKIKYNYDILNLT